MNTFLQLVADDIYKKLDGNFQNTTIIFPNKRASLFFNSHLWRNANGKTIWTPEYTTISELFASLSDYDIADPIFLICKLFDVYSSIMNPSKSLDQLYSMMEIMLADFQDIDNNIVDPKKLFLNISDLKEMTDFSFLEKEQLEAIEQFFGRYFDNVNPNTPIKNQFRSLWNRLTDIYNEFRLQLVNVDDDKAMVYEGMLKRSVIEALYSKDESVRNVADSRLRSENYIVIGFNVLNKTELELFKYLKNNRNTKFYWDYDINYTRKWSTSFLLSKFEAGQFILENISKLNDEFHGEQIFNNLSKSKSIKIIQSPTENAQTRCLDQWIESTLKENEPLNESAIILCNESLLQSTLHSIPKKIKQTSSISKDSGQHDLFKENDAKLEIADKDLTLNITMGYPLQETPIYTLVQVLLELQIHGKTQYGGWHYRYVSAVLKHSLIQRITDGSVAIDILKSLTDNKIIYPTFSDFGDDELLKKIFTQVSGRNLTHYLSEIIAIVGKSYQQVPFNTKDFTQQLYKESAFSTYTVINRIHTLQESVATFAVSDETLMRLIMQFLQSKTIPFHGEPAIGLQIMGLLETRNLDFRNVVMLSVNEGNMPKSEKRNSLIPYNLRAAYGMTTIEKEVSLYAYYYYRLLQRAENITLLYNSNPDGAAKGLMSRFVLQTMLESDKIFSPHQTIELYSLNASSEMVQISEYSVTKTPDVMKCLCERFNSDKILSPSAINTYLSCPLKFYLSYLARLKNDEDIDEEVDNALFGTIFHYVMQHIYEPYLGEKVSSDMLVCIANNKPHIIQLINNAFAVNVFKKDEKDANGKVINYGVAPRQLHLNGEHLINRHVIAEFVKNQILADATIAKEKEDQGGGLRFLFTEKEFSTLFKTNAESCVSKDDNNKNHVVSLGGIIDRIDELSTSSGVSIRIVDYKTASKAQGIRLVSDLFDNEKHQDNYHILQTFYYAKVVHESQQFGNLPLLPALMYKFNNSNEKNKSGIIRYIKDQNQIDKKRAEKIEIVNFIDELGEEFDERISTVINEIFGPGDFSQSESPKPCKYCDFKQFCNRKTNASESFE